MTCPPGRRLPDNRRAPARNHLYYKLERKGKLFNFWEGKEPRYRFEFVALGTGHQVLTENLSDIDANLVAAYRQRVEELG